MWLGITMDIEKYISKCEYCQKNKLFRKSKTPLKITDTPDKLFEKYALDIVGPLIITSTGNKYILIFKDNSLQYLRRKGIKQMLVIIVIIKLIINLIL